MRRGRQEVLDDVALLQSRSLYSPAAAALSPVRIQRNRLDVATACDRDDEILVGDQVLDVELAFVGDDLRPALVAVLVLDHTKLVGHDGPNSGGITEDRAELGDRPLQLLVLFADLVLLQRRQAAQLDVGDVVGLDLGQSEPRHQSLARLFGVGRCADQFDDVVDVVEGDDQPLEDVGPLLGLAQPIAGASDNYFDLVGDVRLDRIRQVESAGNTVDECHHVHAEVVLQLSALVELIEDDLRNRIPLQIDHKTDAGARRLVSDIGNPLQLLGVDKVRNLLGQASLVNHVRDLGDDDARASLRSLLHLAHGANLYRAAPGFVGIEDALAAEDQSTGGKVRSLDVFHGGLEQLRLVFRQLRILEGLDDGINNFIEVVRRNVRRHADGNPAGAVHK